MTPLSCFEVDDNPAISRYELSRRYDYGIRGLHKFHFVIQALLLFFLFGRGGDMMRAA